MHSTNYVNTAPVGISIYHYENDSVEEGAYDDDDDDDDGEDDDDDDD